MAVAFEKNACTADTNYESCTNPDYFGIRFLFVIRISLITVIQYDKKSHFH